MNVGSKFFGLCVAVITALSLLAASASATVIVDDSFADGDLAKTGALDTNWWTSSSSSGLEISPGVLGHVTGTSGRGFHTIFPAQTLDVPGYSLVVSFTFTTPDTVGNRSTAFRVGLFDSLGRAALNNNVSASSGTPNPEYGWGLAVGGPGTQTLPGFMTDVDVNDGPTSDISFREHIVNTVTGTGRLMATTSGFDNSPFTSGPDEGDFWLPNTQYSGSVTVLRRGIGFDYTTTIGSVTHTQTDATIDSEVFDFLGFHNNSRTFGSTSSQGEADNGLDYSNIKIEFLVPEPTSLVLALGAVVALPAMRRRR